MSWKENIIIHHNEISEEFRQTIIKEFIKFIEGGEINANTRTNDKINAK